MKKTKKFLVGLLLCLTTCSSTFALSACEEEAHEHTYATEWSANETHHWHACTGTDCEEVADKAEHAWNAGEITTPATPTANGVKTYTCTGCAQTKTESVAYVVRTTITQAEWEQNLALKNYTVNGTKDGEFYAQFVITETVCYQKGVWGSGECYYEPNGTTWNEVHVTEEGTVDRTAVWNEGYSPADIVWTGLPSEISEFSYNEEKKCYTYGNEYFSMDLYFEDGLIVKYEGVTSGVEGTIVYAFSNIGTTQPMTMPEYTLG